MINKINTSIDHFFDVKVWIPRNQNLMELSAQIIRANSDERKRL